MMFMHNAPSAINLPETRSQPKFQLVPLSVRVEADAVSYRGDEGYALPGSDLNVVKVKGDWLLRTRQKFFPGRHIGV
jgi:hypothetical protein